jgi:hypothetical protein
MLINIVCETGNLSFVKNEQCQPILMPFLYNVQHLVPQANATSKPECEGKYGYMVACIGGRFHLLLLASY